MNNTFSEQKLATALRIKILDHIAEIDLPGFLFEQIDATISELNFYKVSNLLDNIEQYTAYLMGVAKRYNVVVRQANDVAHEPNNRAVNYEPYMTDTLFKEGFISTLSRRQYNALYTTFSVQCLLTMKEYINRRILQSSRVKQRSMAATSAV